MNELTIKDESQLTRILQTSLYPGATNDSIKLVLNYCKASNLDPMQKPVHIVPMSVRDSNTGQYSYRDVIMPGIGLYRIQADRTGNYAGMTEPEFGPDIDREFTTKNGSKVMMSFPEWCKITVKKIVSGMIVEFTAKEYWIENYATDSGKSNAPNAMWTKRPRGQLAKCAEAQALRKGWPEIGAQPTAEEMEGKTLDSNNESIVANYEQPELIDYDEKLKSSKSMAELSTIWQKIPKEEKHNYEEIKDKMKAELSKPVEESA